MPEPAITPYPTHSAGDSRERSEHNTPSESGAVSPAARVLLYELRRAGASREFVRLYHDSLDELTPDDLRALDHALAKRRRPWIDILSQAEFWGWRRWLAALTGRGSRT